MSSKTPCHCVLLAVISAFGVQAKAAVIVIPDALDRTSSYSVTNSVGAAISGENSVYIAGQMTFDTAADPTLAFNVVDILNPASQITYQWGHTYNSSDLAYNIPTPKSVLDAPIAANDSFLAVLKIDQTTGNYSFFLDPNLATLESLNTPFFTRTGGPTVGIASIRFRGGDTNQNSTIVDFTGFRVYTGADTPFSTTAAAVPEPSSVAVWSIIGLGLMGFGSWRRRRSG